MKTHYLMLLFCSLNWYLLAQDTTSTIPNGQVLAADVITTETLVGMKVILNGQVAGLRDSLNQESGFRLVDEQLLDLQQLSDLYIERLIILVPENEEALRKSQKKKDQLIKNLGRDFQESSQSQITATFNLLNDCLEEVNSVSNQLNIQRGIGPSALNPQVPQDWVSKETELFDFRSRYKLQSGEQLLSEFEDRLKILRSASFKKFEDYHNTLPLELLELSKELRSRKSELPVPSQEPFLNCCLQLEVISENIDYYLRENNRVSIRAQLQLAKKTIATSKQFYVVSRSTKQ